MYGPLIEGKLLTLRPPRLEDAEAMPSWFEDLEVTKFLELQHPPSLDMEKEWISSNARDPNGVLWAIEVDGRLVGTTGIREIDWKSGVGETGTLIADKRVWGRGVARELMRLRADYAFRHLPLRKLKSAYYDGNAASGRAQAAAGYREVGRLKKERWADGRWRDLILTELMREDWEKSV
jgi:RimJ/RimL family protein N-acetyltransferase